MSYSDFTINDLKQKLGLKLVEDHLLFDQSFTCAISEDLARYLKRYKTLALAIDTEKARSEYLIAPILGDLKLTYTQQVSLFSGLEFNVDRTLGLMGRCDYVLARSKEQYVLTAPVVMLVEAKNDNIKRGIPQCGAEMVAAQRFNVQNNDPIEPIYGCISTGTIWKFLQLIGTELWIDVDEYYIDNLQQIFAILTQMTVGYLD